jgi:hypothetical protein
MAQAARKLTAKDANEKLAHRPLTVLELAERLGNVAGVQARMASMPLVVASSVVARPICSPEDRETRSGSRRPLPPGAAG